MKKYKEELKTLYDFRKSFYKKAFVETQKNTYEMVKCLYSYGTLVAKYILHFDTLKEQFIYLGEYSRTTTRHQREFFRQQGLTTKEIIKLFNEGELIKNYE